jgi:OmpA family
VNAIAASPAQGDRQALGERTTPGAWTSRRAGSFKSALVTVGISVPLLAFAGTLITASLIDQRNSNVVFGPLMLSETTVHAAPAPPPPPGIEIKPQLSVYFENDSSRISKADSRTLARVAKAFVECNPGTVTVIGSTSTTPYSDALGLEDEGNKRLAARRARAVAIALKDANKELNPKEVIYDRRAYWDSRTSPKLEHPAEHLNRRADIVLENAGCRARDIKQSKR